MVNLNATDKQIAYIESLLRRKEGALNFMNTVEFQAVSDGQGRELSRKQASDFIKLLLELDDRYGD